MLIHKLLNKEPDIVTEEAPLIVLNGNSSMCMTNNSENTKRTRHTASTMHFVRNGEKCMMQNLISVK